MVSSTTVTEVGALAKTFSTCASLNKAYSGGVAQKAGYKNVGGTLAKKPKVSSALYLANKKLDKDKDGIVCEVLKKAVVKPKPTPTPTAAPETPLTLDNLEVSRVRALGVREVIGAMNKALTASPKVTINYNISSTVPTQALADMKLQIDEASKLYGRLFSGQSVAVNIYTEKEDAGRNNSSHYTCGGQAWPDPLRMNLCVPTNGTYGVESPGLGYHEFSHIAQYTQGYASQSNFFMEGIATYIPAVLGFARDGVSDANFNQWLNLTNDWRQTYLNLGYKFTVEDMARFLDVADTPMPFGEHSTYHRASFKVGAAMWEAMIAVYGWEKFMTFFDSLDNGKTYAQNFEANYGLSLSEAHLKVSRYILSIQWMGK